MRRIEVSVDLSTEEVLFLGELAERKRCTLPEMIEDAGGATTAARKRAGGPTMRPLGESGHGRA